MTTQHKISMIMKDIPLIIVIGLMIIIATLTSFITFLFINSGSDTKFIVGRISFEIIDTNDNVIYIKNIGTEPIQEFEFSVNNINVDFEGQMPLAAGEIGRYVLNSEEMKSGSYNRLRIIVS